MNFLLGSSRVKGKDCLGRVGALQCPMYEIVFLHATSMFASTSMVVRLVGMKVGG